MDTWKSTDSQKIREALATDIDLALERHEYDNLRLIHKRLQLGPAVNALPTAYERTEHTIVTGMHKTCGEVWDVLKEGARTASEHEISNRNTELREALEELWIETEKRRRIFVREETLVIIRQVEFGWDPHRSATYEQVEKAGAALGLAPCDADVVMMSALAPGWKLPDLGNHLRPAMYMTAPLSNNKILSIRDSDRRQLSIFNRDTTTEARNTIWIFQKQK
jgi:hypothetical protein